MAIVCHGLLLATPVAGQGGLCSDAVGCSLLGECVGGSCRCDSGWSGAHCGVADLLPMNPDDGYINEGAASWGGQRGLLGMPQYHLWIARESL